MEASGLQLTLFEIGGLVGWGMAIILGIITIVNTVKNGQKSKTECAVSDNERLVRIDVTVQNLDKNFIKMEAKTDQRIEAVDKKVDRHDRELAEAISSAKSAHKRLDMAGIGRVVDD